jgi:ribosome biogenesis GTPase A
MNKNIKEYEEKGYEVVLTNANSGQGINNLVDKILEVGKKTKYANKTSEEYNKMTPIYRVLISGIPNVGKSTIINKLAGKKAANVGNKPGVTRSKQWIRINNNIDLLDTPGILWPKLTENDAGIKLALTGNIKEEILDLEELAFYFIKYVRQNAKYLNLLIQRYGLDKNIEDLEDYEIFEKSYTED